jgi:2-phospho-L-lactate guanylyltransferase (CobY/MobA/RfbA family)
MRFGPKSFAEHLRTAREHGLEARIFECEPLALDIDEPEDLDVWRGEYGANWDDSVLSLSLPLSRLASPE